MGLLAFLKRIFGGGSSRPPAPRPRPTPGGGPRQVALTVGPVGAHGELKPHDAQHAYLADAVDIGRLIWNIKETGGGKLTVSAPGYRTWEGDVVLDDELKLVRAPGAEPTEGPLDLVKIGAARRSGDVILDGKVLRDEVGQFSPRGWTWFWALQCFIHDIERFKETAAFMAGYGFHYPRILCEVGNGGHADSQWVGNLVLEPAKVPDYAGHLGRMMDYLWETHGMRVELCICGKGTDTDLIWLSRTVADVVADGRQHMVIDFEMVNEGFSGDEIATSVQQRMAKIFIDRFPGMAVALTSPEEPAAGDEENKPLKAMIAATRACGANSLTLHLRRTGITRDRGWADVRQGYDCKIPGFAVFPNEGIGPGSSGHVQTDPFLSLMNYITNIAFGGAGYVWHTGTGVFGDGKAHWQVGERPANFKDIQGVHDILSSFVRFDQSGLMPLGIQNWSAENTQRPGIPFDVKRTEHWGNPDSSGWGVNKMYAMVAPDGRFLQIPLGVRTGVDSAGVNHPFLPWAAFAMRDVRVYDPKIFLADGPVDVEPVLTFDSLALNQTIQLPGQEDAKAAYLIFGQRA